MPAKPLVLASASPRRAELLREAGFEPEVLSPEVDEAHDPSLSSAELTIENATRKALAGSRLRPGHLTLGADTLVYVDGDPLAKPADYNEALRMLQRLSGRTHQVCTGVALACDGALLEAFAEISHVTFRPLTAEIIRAYHAKVTPLDKAGGYGIQSHAEMILEHLEGSLSNVIGLPIERVLACERLRPCRCSIG
jgi:septum formation protein